MVEHEHVECQSLLGSLSEYIDGEACDEVCAEIERHLKNCENCRVVVDTLRKTVSLYQVSADDSPAVPQDVRQRLYHCLNLDDFISREKS